MRILVVSPSAARFDATTHYWQAEFAAAAAYLRRRFPGAEVIAVPAGLVCAPGAGKERTIRSTAAYAKDDPIHYQDVLATIYHNMGINPHAMVTDVASRPTPILPSAARVIDKLV